MCSTHEYMYISKIVPTGTAHRMKGLRTASPFDPSDKCLLIQWRIQDFPKGEGVRALTSDTAMLTNICMSKQKNQDPLRARGGEDTAAVPPGSANVTYILFEMMQIFIFSDYVNLFTGYVWLVRNKSEDGTLEIISTANQDCPLTNGQYPILVIDVWEHAYYLGHKNKRPNYIDNWWKVVDWEKVDELDLFWKNRNALRDEL